MKSSLLAITAVLAIALLAQAQQPAAQAPQKPTSNLDRASYAYGLMIGRNMKSEGLTPNIDLLVRGLVDAMKGEGQLLTDQECQAAVQAVQVELTKAVAAKNKAFLEANKKKPGVKATASGLQYKVIKSGNGPSPTKESTVKVHYHGTLIDGTVFDSSVQRNEPISFPVSGVIRGWTEALQLMKVGDKWQLFIPSELGYGERGAGAAIGPNATLIFEVELLAIEK